MNTHLTHPKQQLVIQTVVISTVTNALLWSVRYRELQNKNLELLPLFLAYVLLGLTSCSHLTNTPEQTKYTKHIKPCWQVSHPLHQTVQEQDYFILAWLMLLGWWLTLTSIKHLHVWNQDHLIYDQLTARNVSVFLWHQFTYPLRFLYTLSKWWSNPHKCLCFLNPTHADCLLKETRSSHLCFLPTWPRTEGWNQQALMQSWRPVRINLSKTEP